MDRITVRLCSWISHCQVMLMDSVTVRLCRWIVSLSGYVDG